jgi:hypothetical protein
MTDKILPNTTEGKDSQVPDSTPLADKADDAAAKSRRDAMAVLAKHAAYTAPAVMTILTLSTKRAAAFSF